jgi:Flp pilus assembly protein TadD/GGDEF domain-containing protein
MAGGRTGAVGNRCSTREFLLSRMAPDGPKGPAVRKSSVGLVAFYREFPNVLMGEAFARRVRRRMRQAPRFAMLAVRIDRFTLKKDVPNEQYATQLLLDVAWAIDACCHGADGLWGLLDRRSFGCFLPGRGPDGSRDLAARIQNRLAGLREETVSIGAAAHPLAHFKPEETLRNVRKALRHALMIGPGGVAVFDAVSLNISGDRLFDSGDIAAAAREFRAALSLDPENVNVRNSLGVCYGRLERFDEAMAVFREALVLDPKEPMTFYNAGLVSLMRKDRQRALRYFLQADAVGEDFFEAALQIGRLHLEEGDPEKGRPFLERAADIRPAPGVVHRHLGDCYTRLERYKEALRAYKKALKHNPSDAAALSAVGYLFDVLGEDLDIAVLICQNSVEIAPGSGLCRYRLGRLYYKQHRLDDALHEFLLASEYGCDASEDIEQIQRRRPARAC